MTNIEKLKSYITTGCSAERATLLTNLLDTLGNNYLNAPASTSGSRHHAHKGGLIDHTIEMIELSAILQIEKFGVTNQEFITVAVLHDLRKAGDAAGAEYYVPNILKSGKVSDAKPYEISDVYMKAPFPLTRDTLKGVSLNIADQYAYALANFMDLSDGEASLSLVYALAPDLSKSLSDQEIQGVEYHDLGFGKGRYKLGGKESNLVILIHTADMLSSRKQRNE